MLTKTFPIKTLGVFLLLLSINLKSFAQSGNEIVGIPTTGALGVTVLSQIYSDCLRRKIGCQKRLSCIGN